MIRWLPIILIVLASLKLTSSGKQNWGFVEVRDGAFTFWWLYYKTPAEALANNPLVIWLQGGPGTSSTGFGNFELIGPLDVRLRPRNQTWIQSAHILFIDNPVGTGFSYVKDLKLLAKSNGQIASDLIVFLQEFLRKLPEFQTVPLYIFGESYGGKMAADFALQLTETRSRGKINCDFRGVAFGDPWISPIDSVITWAPYLFSTSLLDSKGFELVNATAFRSKAALDNSDFLESFWLHNITKRQIANLTNGVNLYNVLTKRKVSPSGESLPGGRLVMPGSKPDDDPLNDLMNGPIKQMLRIIPRNVTWGGQKNDVWDALTEDFMKPVTRSVEVLLNRTSISVNVYNGQLDIIVDTIGTVKWVDELHWRHIQRWKNAKRHPIVMNDSTEGFVKSFKNLHFYWILKSGHMVPADNPAMGVELLHRITKM